MKKLLSLSLIIVIVFSLVCTPECVSAQDDLVLQYSDAYSAVLSAAQSCSASVDISDYRIKAEEMGNFMSDFLNNEPLIFHVDKSFYYLENTFGSTVVFTYNMSRTQYEKALETVNSQAEALMQGITEDMSEFDRALILHDRIAEKYHYDLSLNNHDIYKLMTNGKGVCQAYALLYKHLLTKCGIESRIVTSDEIRHAWNIVKIDGVWYNVDVTWDDPVISDKITDIAGLVYHKNFLMSDAMSESLGHLGAKSDIKCTSKKYDSAKFRDINSSFERYKGELYCMKNGMGLAKYIPSSDSFALIYPDSPTWMVWGYTNRYYTESYSGVGLYGDYLIYSSPTAIKAYSFEKNKAEEIFLPDTSSGYIYGLTINGSYVTYSITKGPGSAVREYSCKIELTDNDPDITPPLPFTDIKDGDWFYPYAEYAYRTGLMSGTTDTTFAPDQQTSRAMLVRVLYNMEDLPDVTGYENPFGDVSENAWYTNAIKWAYKNSIVTGTSPTEYSPDDTITREQFAAILFRYAKFKNRDVTKTTDTSRYTDFNKTSPYAKEAMTWANAMSYITGTSPTALKPLDNATRAQMAAILMRYNEEK